MLAGMQSDASSAEPTRDQVDATPGAVLLEFGTAWCGHCRRAQPIIAEALVAHRSPRPTKTADARRNGRGRSVGVKVWPTLVFLKDGKETARLVRPASADEVGRAVAGIE